MVIGARYHVYQVCIIPPHICTPFAENAIAVIFAINSYTAIWMQYILKKILSHQ